MNWIIKFGVSNQWHIIQGGDTKIFVHEGGETQKQQKEVNEFFWFL